LIASVAAGCSLSVDYTGNFACDDEHQCPADFHCGTDGYCVTSDAEGGEGGSSCRVNVIETFDGLDGQGWPWPTELGGGSAWIENDRAYATGGADEYGLGFPSTETGSSQDVTVTVNISENGAALWLLARTDRSSDEGTFYALGAINSETLSLQRVVSSDFGDELDRGTTILASSTDYRVRFAVAPLGDGVALRAKMWKASEAEPAEFEIERVDQEPLLDGPGGVAVLMEFFNGRIIQMDDYSACLD
jgi:hypothetical protein